MADAEDPAMKQVDLELKKVALEDARFELEEKKLKAAIPDFSTVSGGSLTVDQQVPMFGALLATHALKAAVSQAVTAIAVIVKPKESPRVLVTTKAELIDADAAYADVDQGLDELNEQAGAALASADNKGFAPGAWQLIAGALPGVLSLLSAKRTVKSFEAKADNAAAAHLVASGLAAEGAHVLLDDFRTLPRTPTALQAKLVSLRAKRHQLQTLRQQKSGEEASGLTSLVGLIDAFLTRISIAEAGRSPLSEALRWACLHEGDKVAFVILVNARPGSTTQSVDDRPLMMADLFSTVTTMGVEWTLIDAGSSLVKGGGATEGIMALHGKLGSGIVFRPIEQMAPDGTQDRTPTETVAPPWVAGL